VFVFNIIDPTAACRNGADQRIKRSDQFCFDQAAALAFRFLRQPSRPISHGHKRELSMQHHGRYSAVLAGARECAQCGEVVLLPEWSEYVDKDRVRHAWKYEKCGYSFETTICFATEQHEAA
jgi:hypothetical protein